MFGRGRVEKSDGRSGFTVSLLTASATFGLFLLVALIAVWAVYYAPGPSARQGDKTVVTLASGSGVSAIAAKMKAEGVIRSTDLFRAAATLTGADRRLRAGEYEVPSGMSPGRSVEPAGRGAGGAPFRDPARRLVVASGHRHPEQGAGPDRHGREDPRRRQPVARHLRGRARRYAPVGDRPDAARGDREPAPVVGSQRSPATVARTPGRGGRSGLHR